MHLTKNFCQAAISPFGRHACDRLFQKKTSASSPFLHFPFLFLATMAESLAELQVQYQDFLQGEVRLFSL